MKSKEFDSILNECLERLLVKGEALEECLMSYPQQADELEPLLQMALVTNQATAIQPSPEFRARARYQFRSALQELESKKGRPLFSWRRPWVTAVTVFLVLLLVGGGTVVASGDSMPGELLYSVKLATEQVQLTLARSALGKAELCAQLADRRVTEIIYAANKGDAEQTEQATQRLDTCLATIAGLAGVQREEAGTLRVPAPAMAPTPAPPKAAEPSEDIYALTGGESELEITLVHYAVSHPADLKAALETAPESTKPALYRAIAVSEIGYKQALKAVEEVKDQWE